jgi:hypothetical protein
MQAYLLGIGGSSIGSHVEDNVLERSGLRDLPVDTCTNTDGHCSGIYDEVADLTEEVILVGIPVTVEC